MGENRMITPASSLPWETLYSHTIMPPQILQNSGGICLVGTLLIHPMFSRSTHSRWRQTSLPSLYLPLTLGNQCSIVCSNSLSNHYPGTSLVVQWLRIRLPMKGTRVGALVRGDPTCHGATKPVCHNYWACTPRARAPQQEKPTQWEGRALQGRVAPAHRS